MDCPGIKMLTNLFPQNQPYFILVAKQLNPLNRRLHMKILKLQTLRGPNYWSIRRQSLIEMRLDLEEMDEVFSNQVSGFYEGLVEALPSLKITAALQGIAVAF